MYAETRERGLEEAPSRSAASCSARTRAAPATTTPTTCAHQKVRTLIRRDFDEAFRSCDVIAGPVAPSVAFRLGEKTADPLQMYPA